MLAYIKQRISLKFFAVTTISVTVLFVILFMWLSKRQEKLILGQVEKQAIILHRQIVLTRQWVSNHKYVLVTKNRAANPENFATGPSSGKVAGKVYTRVTPAEMTRQLSEYANQNRLYSFNLTNFNGINSNNQPDDFETQAILQFHTGKSKALSRIEKTKEGFVFRYAAPLVVQPSCLACHHSNQYKVGGIGGCISVLIPFDEAKASIRADNISLFFGMSGLTVSVSVVLFLFAQRLIFRPIKEIRHVTSRLKIEAFDGISTVAGDELKEFTGLCYLMDQKLKNQHQELGQKIREATRDLHRTNKKLAAANQQLSAMNKAKSEFFTDISHELRTPLTAIKGAVDLLTRKAVCTDTNYIDIIRKNTEHLTRTIMDFLDYSKIEFNRLELDLSEHCVTEIVRDVIAAQTAMAQEKFIRIELQDHGVTAAKVDRHRIYQVVSNLLSNALKFSPENGVVGIKTLQTDIDILIQIRDQGPGIAREHQESIFHKFFQAPKPSAQGKGGSGIGLAICKGIVEAHGGSVWVESRLGRGSNFMFKLPKNGLKVPKMTRFL